MASRLRSVVGAAVLAVSATCAGTASGAAAPDAAAPGAADLRLQVARLAANVALAEDFSRIENLQRAYGYYLDQGLWEDLAQLFTEDAVANYPAGVFVGRKSIREHLYLNVGGHQIGDLGLGNGRLYDHMNIQPVVHIDAGGRTARGRWRAFAMFGSPGGEATWAEGVYEMQYTRDAGVWKISKLDYYAGFSACRGYDHVVRACGTLNRAGGRAAAPARTSGRHRAQHGLRGIPQGLHCSVPLRQSRHHVLFRRLGVAG
jgi:SnoaL-like domain